MPRYYPKYYVLVPIGNTSNKYKISKGITNLGGCKMRVQVVSIQRHTGKVLPHKGRGPNLSELRYLDDEVDKACTFMEKYYHNRLIHKIFMELNSIDITQIYHDDPDVSSGPRLSKLGLK